MIDVIGSMHMIVFFKNYFKFWFAVWKQFHSSRKVVVSLEKRHVDDGLWFLNKKNKHISIYWNPHLFILIIILISTQLNFLFVECVSSMHFPLYINPKH